jgi:hypothetical protein
MGWRALSVVWLVGCGIEFVNPLEREDRNLAATDAGPDDGGLRDGEMPERIAQEWCMHWICRDAQAQGQFEIVDASCGGRTWYDCR